MDSSSGIRFNDCFFSEPVRIAEWTPPRCAGLFAVLTANLNWAPKGFQPVYFGEFGNNAPASAFAAEYVRIRAAAGAEALFVAVLPMPFSTTGQRLLLRDELISAYNPVCRGEAGKTDAPPEPRRRIGFLPLVEPAGQER